MPFIMGLKLQPLGGLQFHFLQISLLMPIHNWSGSFICNVNSGTNTELKKKNNKKHLWGKNTP